MRALGVLMLWLMATPLVAAEPGNTELPSDSRGNPGELEALGALPLGGSRGGGGGLAPGGAHRRAVAGAARAQGAQRLNLAVLDSLPGAVAILDRQGAVLRASTPSAQREGLGALSTQRLLFPGSSYLRSLQKLAHEGELETAGVATLLEDVLSGRVEEGMVEFRGPRADTGSSCAPGGWSCRAAAPWSRWWTRLRAGSPSWRHAGPGTSGPTWSGSPRWASWGPPSPMS
ncbi:hypothetical protein ACN28S_35925 [Cystobacter fuscus]